MSHGSWTSIQLEQTYATFANIHLPIVTNFRKNEFSFPNCNKISKSMSAIKLQVHDIPQLILRGKRLFHV